MKIKHWIITLIYVLPFISYFFITATLAQETTSSLSTHPINIDADSQHIDIAKDTSVFTGNVVIVQDTLRLKADKVIINNMQNKKMQRIIAIGSPVTFQQILGQQKKVDGYADKLVYDVSDYDVILMGNAYLTHGDNTIRSQIVRYNMIEHRVSANSNQKNRVKTTIVPSQLSELKR